MLDFDGFYQDSWTPCLKAVLASGADYASAEDQLSEAFSRAWASWRTVSRHPAPRAWVVRTALNVGASWWRRRQREVELTGDGPAARAEPNGAVGQELMAALRRLPLREREVVVLRLVLDMDTATAARSMKIAQGTVRAHLAKAMATLRAEGITQNDLEEKECITTT